MKIILPLAAVITAVLMMPRFYPCVDAEKFTGNYRIPYSQGEDYFLYEKYIKTVAASGRIVVIGDSVIWGHYTSESESLASALNKLAGAGRFANAGIDGIHPAALYGLVDNYCPGLVNSRVVAGINLLWMSSRKNDLTAEVNGSINHRALLPQFPGLVPAYSPTFEERLVYTARRNFLFFTWIDHLRASRFADHNFFKWTVHNPRECPSEYLVRSDETFTPPEPLLTWRMTGRDMDWVLPDSSLQWRYMLASLRELKIRGNSVVALITPFNRFMLTEKGRVEQDRILAEMMEQLNAEGVKAFAPVLDKAEYFADMSHPVAAGYKIIASQLMAEKEFAEFAR